VLQTWVWCGLGCRCGCGFVVGSAAGVGVRICCFDVVLPAWVGGFDGGAAGVGVGLMVELPAWVCGFDGGAAGVSVWV
jgi:hypothetical protein